MNNDSGYNDSIISRPPYGADDRVQLVNGAFIDVVNGRRFPPSTSVVIRGDVIESMPGLPGEPSDPGDVLTIDLEGKSVLPAFFNTHCHTSWHSPPFTGLGSLLLGRQYGAEQLEKNMIDCLKHGITTIRDAWTNDLRRTRILQDRIIHGELPGPRIMQTVVISQPRGYLAPPHTLRFRLVRAAAGIPMLPDDDPANGTVVFRRDASDAEVRDAVNRAIDDRGADCIKVAEQPVSLATLKPDVTYMTEQQMAAIMDQARKRGIVSTMHQCNVESLRRGLRAGVHSFAHVPIDEEITEADFEALVKSGSTVEPTVSVGYASCWQLADDPWQFHPMMETVVEFREKTIEYFLRNYWLPEYYELIQSYLGRLRQGKTKVLGVIDLSGILRLTLSFVSSGVANVRSLHAHHVPLTASNDGGVPLLTPAMLELEFALLDLFINHAGPLNFAATDFIHAATINSARALGLDGWLGSIAPGKTADLAVFDLDPFKHPQIIGRPVSALFMNGKLIINKCGLRVFHETPSKTQERAEQHE